MQLSQPSQPSSTRADRAAVATRDSVGRGFVTGLIPLAPVALIVLFALVVTALARQLTIGQDFAIQQLVAVVLLALGLLGATTSYVLFSVRMLRQAQRWQQAGQSAQAAGALAGLVVVALVVALPLLLAILIPQRPAPTLAP